MLNLRGQHLPLRAEGAPIVKGRILLVGDAAGLVDRCLVRVLVRLLSVRDLPLTRSRAFWMELSPTFWATRWQSDREVMPEIRSARVLRDAYDFSPRLNYLAMRLCRPFCKMLCSLMTGDKSYVDFVGQLGPGSVVLRWLAARGRRLAGVSDESRSRAFYWLKSVLFQLDRT